MPTRSQTYHVRPLLKDFPAFGKMMAGIGVSRLELCSPIGCKRAFAVLANGKAATATAATGRRSTR
jgi:hypothetical protein